MFASGAGVHHRLDGRPSRGVTYPSQHAQSRRHCRVHVLRFSVPRARRKTNSSPVLLSISHASRVVGYS